MRLFNLLPCRRVSLKIQIFQFRGISLELFCVPFRVWSFFIFIFSYIQGKYQETAGNNESRNQKGKRPIRASSLFPCHSLIKNKEPEEMQDREYIIKVYTKHSRLVKYSRWHTPELRPVFIQVDWHNRLQESEHHWRQDQRTF